MKRYIIAFMVVLACCIGALAQNPIRWRMSVRMTSAVEGEVTLRALVEPGWHLYGTTLPDNGPKPTRFEFALKGVELTGALEASRAPLSQLDPLFNMQLNWWDSNVEFKQRFKLVNAEGARISATVHYMGCNNKNCLPPKSQTLTYNFK